MHQMMVRYKAWANEVTFNTVSALPAAEIVKQRETNFGTILSTLTHTYVVDDIFRPHLQGRSPPYTSRNPDTAPPLAAPLSAAQEPAAWCPESAATPPDADPA